MRLNMISKEAQEGKNATFYATHTMVYSLHYVSYIYVVSLIFNYILIEKIRKNYMT